MTEQRENSGVLFKNDRKDSDRHPDYKGRINIDGEERWLSAWIKEGKSGKFMSLAIGDRVEPREPKQTDSQTFQAGASADEDSIPF